MSEGLPKNSGWWLRGSDDVFERSKRVVLRAPVRKWITRPLRQFGLAGGEVVSRVMGTLKSEYGDGDNNEVAAVIDNVRCGVFDNLIRDKQDLLSIKRMVGSQWEGKIPDKFMLAKVGREAVVEKLVSRNSGRTTTGGYEQDNVIEIAATDFGTGQKLVGVRTRDFDGGLDDSKLKGDQLSFYVMGGDNYARFNDDPGAWLEDNQSIAKVDLSPPVADGDKGETNHFTSDRLHSKN